MAVANALVHQPHLEIIRNIIVPLFCHSLVITHRTVKKHMLSALNSWEKGFAQADLDKRNTILDTSFNHSPLPLSPPPPAAFVSQSEVSEALE